MTRMSERRHDASTDAADLGFEALGVPPVLVRSLAAMDVTEPTRAQRRALPPSMEGRDVAVVASTGTGKTLAYLLPLAARLLACRDAAGGPALMAQLENQCALRAPLFEPQAERAALHRWVQDLTTP